jgi:uncharacterized protein with ParB-like and HNH nuclease domain
MQRRSNYWLIASLAILVMSCGIKVKEHDAEAVMQNIYKARKAGNMSRELAYYAKKDFEIVSFNEVEEGLRTAISHAGKLKTVKQLETKTQNRNQLGKGLVKYLILSYEVTYANMTLLESYYFLGSSEQPKLVYLTLQL